jgi:hypothetical protein
MAPNFTYEALFIVRSLQTDDGWMVIIRIDRKHYVSDLELSMCAQDMIERSGLKCKIIRRRNKKQVLYAQVVIDMPEVQDEPYVDYYCEHTFNIAYAG